MAHVRGVPPVQVLPARLPPTHRTMSRTALAYVRYWSQRRLASEEAYANWLKRAREDGHTFEEIAKAAGTTRSAIHNYLSRRGQT